MFASDATRDSDCRYITYSSANQLVAAPARNTTSRMRLNFAPSDSRERIVLSIWNSLGLAGLPLQQRFNLREQAVELDRLGVVIVTARVHRPLAVPRHRVRRQRDHRDRA